MRLSVAWVHVEDVAELHKEDEGQQEGEGEEDQPTARV